MPSALHDYHRDLVIATQQKPAQRTHSSPEYPCHCHVSWGRGYGEAQSSVIGQKPGVRGLISSKAQQGFLDVTVPEQSVRSVDKASLL